MAEDRYYVSPYCVIHGGLDGDGAVLLNSLDGSRFEVSGECVKLLGEVMAGRPLAAAAADLSEEGKGAVDALIEEKILLDDEAFSKMGGADAFANRLNPIELAFHRQFNSGYSKPDLSAAGDPPPSKKEIRSSKRILLTAHDSFDREMDLSACLSRRHSGRNYATEPMEKWRLEQFLQLTARVRDGEIQTALGPIFLRNYASGGARYSLELYLVIDNVAEIEPGLYHYCPYDHALERMESTTEERDFMLASAMRSMALDPAKNARPAVLFAITSVFGRVAWKYVGIPYHLILHETGGLYQTMYLAAEMLELAPCPTGAFPELPVADILKLDPRDEAMVGQFVLGMPQPSD